MFRILITDANYKHSIALQRQIKNSFVDVELIGHAGGGFNFAKYYGYLSTLIVDRSLEELLFEKQFDMVLPVGGKSVQTVTLICPEKAVLPPAPTLEICLNKWLTILTAQKNDILVPKTIQVFSLNDLDVDKIIFPCVIKPGNETEAKFVYYANNANELKSILLKVLTIVGSTSQYGVLIQEKIIGVGRGFFALFDKGKPVDIFMHERIREFPVSGGASTAARAIYDEKLKEIGIKLLTKLEYNGVAMVEFKYNDISKEYYLIEINPKYWGSLELALTAGVNFGSDMVRVFRGEKLPYSEKYDREIQFFWPLDQDIVNLWKSNRLRSIREYFMPNSRTNLGDSIVTDVIKFVIMVKKLFFR